MLIDSGRLKNFQKYNIIPVDKKNCLWKCVASKVNFLIRLIRKCQVLKEGCTMDDLRTELLVRCDSTSYDAVRTDFRKQFSSER
jgi:hypothetical protein